MAATSRLMERASLVPLGPLAFALMAASCSPTKAPAQLAVTGSPSAQATLAPSPSPTPPLPAHFQDVELIPLGPSGPWRVAGLLVSDSDASHTGISVQVSLLDGKGAVVARQAVTPLFPDLLSRATVPFVTDFETGPGAERVVASPSGYLPSTLESADVEAEVTHIFTAEDGRSRVLGHLASSDTSPALAQGLAVVVRNPEGRLVDVSSRVIWPRGIGPSERLPFLALVDPAPVDFVFEPIVEAGRTQAVGSETVVLIESPRLVNPPRGTPFLLGLARNQSGEPRWLRGILSLMYQEELLTMAEILSPVPLTGGEALAFSLDDLPGLLTVLRADPGAASEIEIRVRWDWATGAPPAPAPVPLDLSIDAFEAVGETLVLRGTVRNPTPGLVTSPTAFAAVRSLEGNLTAAGWVTAAGALAGEAESEVVLTLRLAEAVEPTEMEFDVRAFGLSP